MSQTAHPFDMIIIGASGDLARRKLVPALFNLHQYDALPEGRIFAVARSYDDPEGYLAQLKESAQEQLGDSFDAGKWPEFISRFRTSQVSATELKSWKTVTGQLKKHPDRVRVFYLATPPSLYGDISQTLSEAGLVTDTTRIVLEKPIGSDLQSAQDINRRVGEYFNEPQIYRIDHYLGKETVQNLMALRFSNALFEPLWRSQHIDHVQITVAETLGMEGRGGYYDHAGALRDMVQNHLLQLLCLTAMEPPAKLNQDSIRAEKIKVLKSLRPMSLEDIKRKTVRAQYRHGVVEGKEVVGFHQEKDIARKSVTETFVAVKAEIDNWRWAGVPFYLRTGKRMGHRVSEIIIQFKTVPHLLFEDQKNRLQDNRLVIRLQPDESIKLWLMIKKPGSKLVLKRTHLNLNLADTYEGSRPPLAYERLLQDVIRGNATLFMHRDEVEEAWRWIEPILDGWEELGTRPRIYSAGSWGPAESIALMVRDEREWLEHLV